MKGIAHQLGRRVSAEPTSPPLLGERRTWVVITLVWCVLGIGSWLLEYALSFGSPEGPITLGRAAARLVYAVLCWGVSVFAVWICDRLTVRRPSQYHRWGSHLVMGAAIAVAWAVLAYYVNLAIIPGWLPQGVGRMVNTTFMTSYFYYLGMVVLVHGIIFARESRAREVNALQKARLSVEAQLQALKMELQPHFLFNTLNTISALMHRDVEIANEVLVLLADMLEVALENVRDQEVTLQEEIETLKIYIRIQQVRFRDRLKVDYDIDPDALSTNVPHMIFQPLVENAIKHGIADRAAGGKLETSARVLVDDLQLTVQDDGVGLKDMRPHSGIGLKNTRERLAVLYGERHRFELRNVPEGGARVDVSIPLRRPATVDPRR